jgi:hypothetical protein
MAFGPLDHDALKGALESAGLRCTPQRFAGYDQLSGELHHPTAEDLSTGFDPALVSKLDPELEGDLKRQGFQLTGCRLELIGYRNNGSLATNSRHQNEALNGPALKTSLADENETQG